MVVDLSIECYGFLNKALSLESGYYFPHYLEK
jgi:hypothetical protein